MENKVLGGKRVRKEVKRTNFTFYTCIYFGSSKYICLCIPYNSKKKKRLLHKTSTSQNFVIKSFPKEMRKLYLLHNVMITE